MLNGNPNEFCTCGQVAAIVVKGVPYCRKHALEKPLPKTREPQKHARGLSKLAREDGYWVGPFDKR